MDQFGQITCQFCVTAFILHSLILLLFPTAKLKFEAAIAFKALSDFMWTKFTISFLTSQLTLCKYLQKALEGFFFSS